MHDATLRGLSGIHPNPSLTPMHYASVFDGDDTLFPNSGWTFYKELWRDDRRYKELWETSAGAWRRGPFAFFRAIKAMTDPRSWLAALEEVRQDPRGIALFSWYGGLSLAPLIYQGIAEELVWRRANLQTIVLITGGFRAFLEPFLGHLPVDYLFLNEGFRGLTVTGKKKPQVLRGGIDSQGRLLRLGEEGGPIPGAVYTDSLSDLPLIQGFHWQEINIVEKRWNIVEPFKDMPRYARSQGWNLIKQQGANRHYPESVRDYARFVMRADSPPSLRIGFYRLRKPDMFTHRDILDNFRKGKKAEGKEQVIRRSYLTTAGLYLKEDDEMKGKILSFVGPDFDALCFELYQILLRRAGAEPFPILTA